MLDCELWMLTITIDEEVDGVISNLEKCIALVGAGNVVGTPDCTMHVLAASHNELVLRTRPWAWNNMHSTATAIPQRSNPDIPDIKNDGASSDSKVEEDVVIDHLPSSGLRIKIFTIQGCISPNEDARQLTPSGAVGATAIQAWVATQDIRPAEIRYGGHFTRRVLQPDGSLPVNYLLETNSDSECFEEKEDTNTDTDNEDDEDEGGDDSDDENTDELLVRKSCSRSRRFFGCMSGFICAALQ